MSEAFWIAGCVSFGFLMFVINYPLCIVDCCYCPGVCWFFYNESRYTAPHQEFIDLYEAANKSIVFWAGTHFLTLRLSLSIAYPSVLLVVKYTADSKRGVLLEAIIIWLFTVEFQQKCC